MPRWHEDEQKDTSFSLTFGGGMNTTESPFDIDPEECTYGFNFELEIDKTSLTPRRGMHAINLDEWSNLVTAPGDELDGYAQYLEYEDGGDQSKAIIHTLFQSGTQLYYFSMNSDGDAKISVVAFAGSPATVTAGSKLRGYPDTHTSEADRGVIITDLNLKTPVLLWKPLDNTLEYLSPGTTGGFYARRCLVENERAWFSNIRSGTGPTYTPHMVVASKVENINTVSVGNRPSSGLGAGDAFYFLTPDFSAASTLISVLGTIVVMTGGKNIYSLGGSSSKDYFLDRFFAGYSGATSEQPADFAGNDVAFSNASGIQSLAGVQAFGDVETDDLSRKVRPDLGAQKGRYVQRHVPNAAPLTGQDTFPYESGGIFKFSSYRGSDPGNIVFNERLRTLFVKQRGGDVWAFYKSFHDQLARDVSLLRKGPELSGWQKVVSEITTRLSGVSAGLKNSTMFATDMWPFYITVDADEGPPVTTYESFEKTVAVVSNLYGDPTYHYHFLAFLHWPASDKVDIGVETYNNYPRADTIMVTADDEYNDTQMIWRGATEMDIVVYRVSKMLKTPSGLPFKDFTGWVTYFPVDADDVTVELTFIYSGERTIVKKKSVVLDGLINATGNVKSPHHPLRKRFSVPNVNATELQIGVSVTSQANFEILSVDFSVKA